MDERLVYVDGDLGEFNKKTNLCVYNMLIRTPESAEIIIPSELEHSKEAIKLMSNHAISIINKYKLNNPKFMDNFKFYLTYDQKTLNSGEQHRGPNPHTDDIQGPRYNNDKSRVGFEYILSDNTPTIFYKNPTELSFSNENKEDLWNLIEDNADEMATYKAEINKVGFMNFYQIHRGDYVQTKTDRTFIKLCVTEKLFDADSDTVNPHLSNNVINGISYPWKITSRKSPGFVKFVKKNRM